MSDDLERSTSEVSGLDPRTVFVVHGRNEDARRAMFEFLRSLDLRPIEWEKAIELTGKASPYIGEVLDVAFNHARAVVVLMTPDEIAYLQPRFGYDDNDPETQPAAQARPNVLFEAGMALGRNPDRTVLVELGEVRPFSDVAGRHAIRLSNDPAKRQDLANRLRTAGCPVDLVGSDWHTAGDFTPPAHPGGGKALGRRVPSAVGQRPIDFALRYTDRGGTRLSKLTVINRGTDSATNVTLAVPENAALGFSHSDLPIAKIPGGGKSVTIDVDNHGAYLGGRQEYKFAFDVTVSATDEHGEPNTQDVFLDMNG